MGCASSNPLVEGGKNLMENAKETKDVVVERGGKALHDAGEAVSTSVDHMKTTVESGLQTAQHGIGNVVNSIESKIGVGKTKAEENMTAAEDASKAATEAIDEAISDTKTVLAFEDATNTLAEKEDAIKHEFGESVKEMNNAVEETLHIEDMEQTIEDVLETPTKKESPKKEVKAEEEPPPTPWEAEADRILEKSLSMKSFRESPKHLDAIDIDSEAEETDPEIERRASKENYDSKEYGDILLSDTLSMKSYKSEI